MAEAVRTATDDAEVIQRDLYRVQRAIDGAAELRDDQIAFGFRQILLEFVGALKKRRRLISGNY